jgi:hypothetical protein
MYGPTAFNGRGTGGHGRVFAQEDSNLTARRPFLPEKYPSPITTDRQSQAGGMGGSGVVELTVEGTATRATQLSFELCGKSAEESVSATGATPDSN